MLIQIFNLAGSSAACVGEAFSVRLFYCSFNTKNLPIRFTNLCLVDLRSIARLFGHCLGIWFFRFHHYKYHYSISHNLKFFLEPVKAYLTPKQLAAEFDFSKTYNYRRCRTGNFRSHKVGGRWRIDPDVDLDSFSNPMDEQIREGLKSRGW